ncbi:MAG TPA: hypothetical protein VKO43_06515, partial [Candidatus Krumholzibacteriaceae bacterium]|nr:hypothetical protein [Candidatus Krumholzibacteriaceae bacterium]
SLEITQITTSAKNTLKINIFLISTPLQNPVKTTGFPQLPTAIGTYCYCPLHEQRRLPEGSRHKGLMILYIFS